MMTLASTKLPGMAVVVLLAACSAESTSTTAEVTRFQYTSCDPNGGKTEAQLFTGRSAADYAGLECVAWAPSAAGGLSIDLINVPGACGFAPPTQDLWRGSAATDATGALTLSLEWNSPGANGCTGCLHDFSFELPTRTSGDLDLTIRNRACTGGSCPWATDSLVVPTGSKSSGILCRYLELASASSYRGVPSAGMANMPPANGGCSSPLLATPTSYGVQVCTDPCNTSADCHGDVLTCQDARCLLSQSW